MEQLSQKFKSATFKLLKHEFAITYHSPTIIKDREDLFNDVTSEEIYSDISLLRQKYNLVLSKLLSFECMLNSPSRSIKYLKEFQDLIDEGADVNYMNHFDQNCLMNASLFGYNPLCNLLIQNKININQEDNCQHNCLWHAMSDGYDNTCKLLIKNKINSRNYYKILNWDIYDPCDHFFKMRDLLMINGSWLWNRRTTFHAPYPHDYRFFTEIKEQIHFKRRSMGPLIRIILFYL